MSYNQPIDDRSPKRSIIHALIFACAILLASYISKGTDAGQTIIFLLIAVWFSLQSYADRKHYCGHRS